MLVINISEGLTRMGWGFDRTVYDSESIRVLSILTCSDYFAPL